MNFDVGRTLDSIIESTKEIGDTAHEKTNDFHENYVSKVLPDCGKFGDVARFGAEMVPGVAEYNDIRDGDWRAAAIDAGMDIAAFAVGAVTAGVGLAAIKGGSAAAKSGVKIATKEIAEVGAEKAAKEIAQTGLEKVAKETAEAGTEKAEKHILRYMECRNKALAGTVHPITGVEFVEKTVYAGKGEWVKGVFAKFDSNYNAKLSRELYEEANKVQFREANRQLLKSIEHNPLLEKKFTAEQLDQIKEGVITGMAPDGFVWHHNEKAGVLQLVDANIHAATGHTGGRLIWGGGY